MHLLFVRHWAVNMADQEVVKLENDFHVSSDIDLDVEGDIRVTGGVSSDDEEQTTLDEPISATLVIIFLKLYCSFLSRVVLYQFIKLMSKVICYVP